MALVGSGLVLTGSVSVLGLTGGIEGAIWFLLTPADGFSALTKPSTLVRPTTRSSWRDMVGIMTTAGTVRGRSTHPVISSRSR